MPTLNDAAAVYVGSTPAQAVYLGDTKVWPAATAATPPLVQAILDLGAVVCWYDNKEWAAPTPWTAEAGRRPAPATPWLTVPMYTLGANGVLANTLPVAVPVPYTILGITAEAYIYAQHWARVDGAVNLVWSPYHWHDRYVWSGTAWGDRQTVQVGFGGFDPMFRAYVTQADGQDRYHAAATGHSLHTATVAPIAGQKPLPAAPVSFKAADNNMIRHGLLAVIPAELTPAQIETLWSIIQGTPP